MGDVPVYVIEFPIFLDDGVADVVRDQFARVLPNANLLILEGGATLKQVSGKEICRRIRDSGISLLDLMAANREFEDEP